MVWAVNDNVSGETQYSQGAKLKKVLISVNLLNQCNQR